MVGGIIVVAVILGIIFFGSSPNFSLTQTPAGQKQDNSGNSQNSSGDKTIEYTDSGFSPNPLTIQAGETVTFINRSLKPVWPASAMHPTHTVYPGSDIKKCGTAEQSAIFDACRGLNPGESWSFQFNEKGSWNYHDHLGPTKFGKIVVE